MGVSSVGVLIWSKWWGWLRARRRNAPASQHSLLASGGSIVRFPSFGYFCPCHFLSPCSVTLAVLMAEVVAHYFPKYVELHNYSAANSLRQKLYNWSTLNRESRACPCLPPFVTITAVLSTSVCRLVLSSLASTQP